MDKDVKKINGLEKELYSDRERMEIWIAANWKKSAVVAVILVVIAVSAYGVLNYREGQRAKAESKLADTPSEQLAEQIAANPDLAGVPVAQLRLAQYLISKKDYKGAAECFRSIAGNKNADQVLVVKARMALAAVLEKEGDIGQAAAEYMAIENSAASDVIKAEAGFQAARLLIAQKKFTDAEAYLTRITSKKFDQMTAFYQELSVNLLNSLKNGDFAVEPAKKTPAKSTVAAPKK